MQSNMTDLLAMTAEEEDIQRYEFFKKRSEKSIQVRTQEATDSAFPPRENDKRFEIIVQYKSPKGGKMVIDRAWAPLRVWAADEWEATGRFQRMQGIRSISPEQLIIKVVDPESPVPNLWAPAK